MLSNHLLSLDFYLRAGSMVMLLVFFSYTLVLSKRAGEAGIEAKKKYFLAFSFFFLFYALNFLQTELTIWNVWAYPDVIPGGGFNLFGFIHPMNVDVFLFMFFFLGAAPLSFAIEKYLLMHKRVPLTILVIAGLMSTLLVVFFPVGTELNEFFAYLAIGVGYLATIAVVLTVLVIYMRFAIISSGRLKAMGFLMFFGLVLQVASLFLSSTDLGDFVLTGAELAHVIGLAGFFLIFASIIQMK